MQDRNWYTASLFALGIYSLFQLLFIHIDNWFIFTLLTVLVIILELFPIKLLTGHDYTAGIIGKLLVLYQFGVSATVLTYTVSSLFLFLKSYGSFQKINWFRYFVTSGMYFVGIVLSFVVINLTDRLNLIVQVFLAGIVFELINYFLMAGILKMIAGTPLFQKFSTSIPTILISVVTNMIVLPHFLSIIDSRQFIHELIYTAFFLLLIIFFSRQYSKDIAKRKQTEEKLRESEAKYRYIAEHTSDLIWVLDTGGRVIYASPSNQTVLGQLSKSKEEKFPIDRVHPEDVSDLRTIFFRGIGSDKPFEAEFRMQSCLGEWISIEAYGKPVVENGTVETIVIVARDITKRKHTEELLRKSDKLSAVGQLAAGVAHEIRNPLTSIKGFMQLFKTGTSTQEYLDIVLSEIDRMESIINEFLVLARPQAVDFKLKDPIMLLKHVTTLLTSHALMNNVELVSKFETDIPAIKCDENQLKQVFINLIQNAIEAMSDGGVVQIIVKAQEPDRILIRVIDQGCGISEDRISRLGEPFYSTKEKGTGLGLMISYKIIEEHGGEMEIYSEVNQGTTVDVILPCSAT